MSKPIVLANWKMHGSLQQNAGIIQPIVEHFNSQQELGFVCGICPPTIYVSQVAQLLANTLIEYGVQDLSCHEIGAYTGEISAPMLSDLGCRYAIVGHSERRLYHAETNELIIAKAEQASALGIVPVYCVGETFEQRKNNQQNTVISQQINALLEASRRTLDKVVIAYEPIWAIGSGETATPDQAQEIHQFIQAIVTQHDKTLDIPILYGGSVSENNAVELAKQASVNGFLVGGASLKPQSFIKICEVF